MLEKIIQSYVGRRVTLALVSFGTMIGATEDQINQTASYVMLAVFWGIEWIFSYVNQKRLERKAGVTKPQKA